MGLTVLVVLRVRSIADSDGSDRQLDELFKSCMRLGWAIASALIAAWAALSRSACSLWVREHPL